MSNLTIFEEELVRFKKSNKVRREIKARSLGFTDAAAYIAHLEKEIVKATKNKAKVTESKVKAKAQPKKTIHIVDILDRSGSMSAQNKFNIALQAINTEILRLQLDKTVNYTYTLCMFDYEVDIIHLKVPIKEIRRITGRTNSTTALYDAIGITIESLDIKPKIDNYLVNIYTDGGENASRKYKALGIQQLLAKYKKSNCTITFTGTEEDINHVVNLGVDRTNTMAHDNTSASVHMMFAETATSRSAYSKSVIIGADTSKGFYKKIKK